MHRNIQNNSLIVAHHASRRCPVACVRFSDLISLKRKHDYVCADWRNGEILRAYVFVCPFRRQRLLFVAVVVVSFFLLVFNFCCAERCATFSTLHYAIDSTHETWVCERGDFSRIRLESSEKRPRKHTQATKKNWIRVNFVHGDSIGARRLRRRQRQQQQRG